VGLKLKRGVFDKLVFSKIREKIGLQRLVRQLRALGYEVKIEPVEAA